MKKEYVRCITMMVALVWSISTAAFSKSSDVYLVFYATIDGKSGHVGIAVDNYKVIVTDVYNEVGKIISQYDTIADGSLTYYDIWPLKDDFNAKNVAKDFPAKYYKLPAASWEAPITINSLMEKGIPHEEGYPVDGLLKIPTFPLQDYRLNEFMDSLIEEKHAFNVRKFNCADFVEIALEYVCQCDLEAEELIFFKHSTTPNRLYLETEKIPGTIVLKDAREKAKKSFTKERLIKRRA